MSKFESKLSAFGKQRFANTATQLTTVVNPRRRHMSIAWITTPVAAFVGIIIGLGIQSNTKNNGSVVKQDVKPNVVKQVIELPEYCCYNLKNTVALPEFEYIINPL